MCLPASDFISGHGSVPMGVDRTIDAAVILYDSVSGVTDRSVETFAMVLFVNRAKWLKEHFAADLELPNKTKMTTYTPHLDQYGWRIFTLNGSDPSQFDLRAHLKWIIFCLRGEVNYPIHEIPTL